MWGGGEQGGLGCGHFHGVGGKRLNPLNLHLATWASEQDSSHRDAWTLKHDVQTASPLVPLFWLSLLSLSSSLRGWAGDQHSSRGAPGWNRCQRAWEGNPEGTDPCWLGQRDGASLVLTPRPSPFCPLPSGFCPSPPSDCAQSPVSSTCPPSADLSAAPPPRPPPPLHMFSKGSDGVDHPPTPRPLSVAKGSPLPGHKFLG